MAWYLVLLTLYFVLLVLDSNVQHLYSTTMRLNLFIAQATGLSRRQADRAIESGRVTVDGLAAKLGQPVNGDEMITLDSKTLKAQIKKHYILFNKPVGYICSRTQQGRTPTIYELLPPEFLRLKPVGRLDKDSSGLLLLTDDGELHQKLTHPKFAKQKVYEISLDKPLLNKDFEHIDKGVELADGLSRLKLDGRGRHWTVTMSEGRNRQIRRTFAALGYRVVKLHRTDFGPFNLDSSIEPGKFEILSPSDIRELYSNKRL